MARPLARHLPKSIATVRDLVPYVQTSGDMDWTRERIAAIVKTVVIQQMNLEESQYSEDTTWDKLGM